MAKDEKFMEFKDIFEKVNKDNKGFAIIGIAIVLGIYAKLTGDIRPLAGFVILMILVALFMFVNTVMGKLKGGD
jgi:hypothetical protein